MRVCAGKAGQRGRRERNKSKHELGGFSKPAEGLEKDRL